MQKKSNCNSGITLIALIITIIVMLILVAVTVNTAVNSGLFGHAKNATQGWKTEEEKEMNLGNDNYIKDTVNKYTSKVDRSYLKVGDYIDYTPDTVGNYMELGTSTTADDNPSGSFSNPTDGIPQDTTLKWRIMSINDDGSVDIISSVPTSTTVSLRHSIGYNNGVLLLNNLCSHLYSNSTLGVTARSMNLIDIENKFNNNAINAKNNFANSDINTQYGGTKTYEGDYSYSPNIYYHVGRTIAEESKNYYTTPTTETHIKKETLLVQQTYYRLEDIPANYFDDSSFYELIFNMSTDYWLATRFANCLANDANFGFYYVGTNKLSGDSVFSSSNNPGNRTYHVRPVVSLGSDIQISQTGGTADSPRTLSK